MELQQSNRRASHPSKVEKKITPFGWACLSICGVLMSTLWWQPHGTGHFLALALIGAVIWSWFTVGKDLVTLQARWLNPGSAPSHEATAVGCEVGSQATTGPFALIVSPDQGEDMHLAHVAGTGTARSRLIWATRFTQRGINTLPELWAEHTRPFGLMKGRIRCADEDDILVLPSIGQIRPEILDEILSWIDEGYQARDPGHDELAQLRPYRSGDSMRTVHWRASARMRHILVTERHAPHAHKITIFLDNFGPDGRRSSRFERLICATATVIDYFSEQGWQIQLTGPWLTTGGVTGNRTFLLESLASVECDSDRLNGENLPSNDPCILFTLDDNFSPSDGQLCKVITLSHAENLVRMGRHIK